MVRLAFMFIEPYNEAYEQHCQWNLKNSKGSSRKLSVSYEMSTQLHHLSSNPSLRSGLSFSGFYHM